MRKLAKILCLVLMLALTMTMLFACSNDKGEDPDVNPPSGGNPDTLLTSFTPTEKQGFIDLIGEVIPFLNSYSYSVTKIGDTIYYVSKDIGEKDFANYTTSLISAGYHFASTKNQSGVTWFVYEKGDISIDVARYLNSASNVYVVEARVYSTATGTPDNPGGGYNPGGDNPDGDTPTPPTPPALGFDSSYLVTILPEYEALPANFELKYNVGDDKYRVVRYLGSIYTEIRKLDGAVYNAYILTNDGEYYHYSWDNTSTAYTDNGVLEREEALEKIGVEMFDTVGRSIYGSYLAWAQMSYDCLYGTSTNKVFEIDNTWSYKGNTGTVVPNTRGLENQTHLFYIDKTYGAVMKILDKENDKVIFEHVSLTTATSLGEYSVTNNIIPEVITPPVQPDNPDDTPSGGGTGGVKPEKTTLTSVILGTPSVMDTVYKRSHSKAYEIFENGKIITNMYTEGEIINDQWYIAYASGDVYKREGDNFVNQSSLKNESFPSATVHLLFHDAGAKQLFDKKYYESVGDELYKVKEAYYEEVLGHFGIVDTEHIKMEEMYMYPIEDGLYFYEEWEESTPTCDTTFWFELEVRYTSETKVDEDKHCINLKVDYNSGMAKLNKFQAKAGETIEITVTCEEGVTLDSITVDGEEISGTSFTMPDKDVLVEVNFDAPQNSGGTGGTGTGGTGTGGSGSGSDLALIFLPKDVEHGKVITDEYAIETTAGAKYKVLWEADSIYYTLEYIKVNDAKIDGDTFIAVAGENDVTIKFKLRDDAPFFDVTCAENQHGKVFADIETTIPGEIVTLSHECGIGNAFDYYTVNGVKIKGNTFIMPANDVEVDVVFKVGTVPVYDVTAKVEGDTKTTVTTSLSRSDEGREVTFTINLAFRYIIDRVTVNGVTVTDYTFKMPAEDVEIVVYTIPEPQYTITLDQSAIDAGFDIQLDKTTAYKGETITLTHNETNSNNEFILAVKANDVRYEGDSFIMPAEDVVVTIVTRSVDEKQALNTLGTIYVYDELGHDLEDHDAYASVSGDLKINGKIYVHVEFPEGKYIITDIRIGNTNIDDMVKIDEHTYMAYLLSTNYIKVYLKKAVYTYIVDLGDGGYQQGFQTFSDGVGTSEGGDRVEIVPFYNSTNLRFSHIVIDGTEVCNDNPFTLPYRNCTIKVCYYDITNGMPQGEVYASYEGNGNGRIVFEKPNYLPGETIHYKIYPDKFSYIAEVKIEDTVVEPNEEGEYVMDGDSKRFTVTFMRKMNFDGIFYLEGKPVDCTVQQISEEEIQLISDNLYASIKGDLVLGGEVYIGASRRDNSGGLYDINEIIIHGINEGSGPVTSGTNCILASSNIFIEVHYERRPSFLYISVYADDTRYSELDDHVADKEDIRLGDVITFDLSTIPEYFELQSFYVEYYDKSTKIREDVVQNEDGQWTYEVKYGKDHWFYIMYDDLRPTITSQGEVRVTVSQTRGWKGDVITLAHSNAAIPEGYEFSHYTVNGEPIEGNTFIMPDSDCDVEVSVVLVPTLE